MGEATVRPACARADAARRGSGARAAATEIASRLAAAGVATPEADARMLLRYGDRERLGELVARREAREPLQLILGSVGFRYLDLAVRGGVFIPRPETEVLAGEAIARVPPGGIVAEPCTGTGAVAIAVATESSAGEVHAADISADAVALARRNAEAAGAALTLRTGDLLAPFPGHLRGRLDVLVANPPYLADDEMAAVEPEVGRWDPAAALVSGPTGHEATDRLIAAAGDWLRPGGWLLLEVAEARASQTAARAAAAGMVEADVVRDLTGRPRVVTAQRPAEPVEKPSPGRKR